MCRRQNPTSADGLDIDAIELDAACLRRIDCRRLHNPKMCVRAPARTGREIPGGWRLPASKGITGCLQVWHPNAQFAAMHIDIEEGAKIGLPAHLGNIPPRAS